MKNQDITLKAIFATMIVFVCLITTSFANPIKGVKQTTPTNVPPRDVVVLKGGMVVVR